MNLSLALRMLRFIHSQFVITNISLFLVIQARIISELIFIPLAEFSRSLNCKGDKCIKIFFSLSKVATKASNTSERFAMLHYSAHGKRFFSVAELVPATRAESERLEPR